MARSLPALLVTALILGVLAPRPARAGCQCARRPLDLAFVIDRSGSMEDEIDRVYEELARLVAVVRPRVQDLRIAFVTYSGDVRHVDLTSDVDRILRFIAGLEVGGGFEPVDRALETAVDELSWREEGRRVIVLVGDEPPNSYEENGRTVNGPARAAHAATRARRRGIQVDTVSTNDQPVDRSQVPAAARPRLEEALERYRDAAREATTPEERRRAQREYQREVRAILRAAGYAPDRQGDLRMDDFVRIADRGRGRAVHVEDADELIPHLIEFSLGYRVDLEPRGADREAVDRAEAAGELVIGVLPLDGDPPPRTFETLAEDLERRMGIRAFPGAVPVSPSDPAELAAHPLLLAAGHDGFELEEDEVRNLRRLLEAGGMLYGEACCGREPWADSFRRLVERLYPSADLAPLPADHPLFDVLHEVEPGPAERRPRAVRTDGVVRVVWSPVCLGCETTDAGDPCMVEDPDRAFRLLENVVTHALLM